MDYLDILLRLTVSVLVGGMILGILCGMG